MFTTIFQCLYIQFVGDKVAYALSQGLKVIACVGETLEQRESGSTMAVVAAQTQSIAGALFLMFGFSVLSLVYLLFFFLLQRVSRSVFYCNCFGLGRSYSCLWFCKVAKLYIVLLFPLLLHYMSTD